jgi:hypothetical protein
MLQVSELVAFDLRARGKRLKNTVRQEQKAKDKNKCRYCATI